MEKVKGSEYFMKALYFRTTQSQFLKNQFWFTTLLPNTLIKIKLSAAYYSFLILSSTIHHFTHISEGSFARVNIKLWSLEYISHLLSPSTQKHLYCFYIYISHDQ